MLEALAKGGSMGLLLAAIGFGPILFLIIDATIERGRRAGLAVSAGVYISDIVLVAIYLATSDQLAPIINHPYFKITTGIIGAALMIWVGLLSIQRSNEPPVTDTQRHDYVGYFFKGVAINTFNPFSLLFWFIEINELGSDMSLFHKTIMALTTVHIVLLSDLTKTYYSIYIKRYINGTRMSIFKKTVGWALIIAAAILIIRVLLKVLAAG